MAGLEWLVFSHFLNSLKQATAELSEPQALAAASLDSQLGFVGNLQAQHK